MEVGDKDGEVIDNLLIDTGNVKGIDLLNGSCENCSKR